MRNSNLVAGATLILTACGGSGLGAYDSTDTGAPVVPPLTSTIQVPDADMIDDLEDGDGAIIEVGGRIGDWYTYNDGTPTGVQTPPEGGTFTPEAGGANGSAYAAHTSGSGFAEWGAGMSFGLKDDGYAKSVFDASSYTGISFWAKGNITIFVSVPTDGVTDQAWGGTCVAGPGEYEGCDDAHGMYVALTDTWAQYGLPFASVQQGGWGQAIAFDAGRLLGVQFETGQGLEFDVWVDDVGFYH